MAKQMRHFFSWWGHSMMEYEVIVGLTPQSNFTSYSHRMALLTLAAISTNFLEHRELGFSLDISRMKFPDDLFEKMRAQIEHAFAAMRELDTGELLIPQRTEGWSLLAEESALAPHRNRRKSKTRSGA